MSWEPVIGLEVHVQLNTATKIFCSCTNLFGAEPNTHVCPVCLGLPGTLPVLNKKSLEYALKAALMLHCAVSDEVVFERKNYFYPDLPKAYQISQYKKPVGENGYLDVPLSGSVKRIGVTRVHMEEDAGKLLHPDKAVYSGVDYNRTGTPLIEIVSEPDIRTPEEAYGYLTMLKLFMTYLGISDCTMEEGSLRCDANVSVRKQGTEPFGTKAEVKNMNSFKNVAKALEYEIDRQISLLEDEGAVVQETRLWDADRQKTFSMRSKEKAHDYRYFPDPDLVPYHLPPEWVKKCAESLPEEPMARQERFVTGYEIPVYDAEVLCGTKELADFFEETTAVYPKAKIVSNWIMSELLKEVNRTGLKIAELVFKPVDLAELLKMIEEKVISGKIAKEVFAVMFAEGVSPRKIVEQKGLLQISDTDSIRSFVLEAINANPKTVEDYRGGKKNAASFLVGQVMRLSRGKANPGLVNKLIAEELEKLV